MTGAALVVLTSLLATSSLAEASRPIRVRLAGGLQSVDIRGDKIQLWLDGRRLPGEGGSSVRVEGDVFSEGHGRDLEVRGENLRMGRTDLPGHVHFLPRKDGVRFDLVSHLELEEYLLGVLPSEMPLSWPLEALKAQAVAARSFAVALMEERKSKSFDVESTVLDQAYQARHVAFKDRRWKAQAQSAVRSTAGQVLKVNGQTLRAHYHADCGGKTELASRVWGVLSDLENPKVKFCHHQESTQWEYEVKKGVLAKQLSDRNTSGLVAARIASRNSSSRVDAVRLRFKDGTIWKISAQDLRKAVGFSRLKSTHFTLEDVGDRLIFKGQGFGHGVGMCQYGARAMARSGKDYREILKFYFPASGLAGAAAISVSGF